MKTVSVDNKYSLMQKSQMNASTANMKKLNHKDHNENPDYWETLLGDVTKEPEAWEGKKALDFGCGCGRNVENLLKLAEWGKVDGVDISENNIEYCKSYIRNMGHIYEGRYDFYANNGIDLRDIGDEEYDFVMSTIVFQHICVHSIRFSLKSEIFRVLKKGGVFSFQMNYGPANNGARDYHDDHYDAKGTNSMCDTRVDRPEDIVDDLQKIGFKNITYKILPSFSCDAVNEWIYVRCEK